MYNPGEMNSKYHHSFVVATLIFTLAFRQMAVAQGDASVMAQHPDLSGASIGLIAFDIISGEVLDSFNADKKLCPASVWKLATTAAALDLLGADFRFSTELSYSGTIKGRTLYGDVVITGGGDPTLGSRHLGTGFESLMKIWVGAIRTAGIDTITGQIIGNAGHFQGDGLPRTRIWEDMGNYYGAAVSGLNIHDNTYFIKFQVPAEPGQPAKVLEIKPRVPELEIRSEVLAGESRSDQAFIFGSPFDSYRMVRGTLPAGSREYEIKGSLPDPALFASYHLMLALTANGAVVQDGYISEPTSVREPATLKLIHRQLSPPLSQLVKHTNSESNNLYAETLLLQIGVMQGNPTIQGGLDALTAYYSKVCNNKIPFFAYDGSGLSRFTSIAPEQLMSILMHIRQKPELKTHLLDVLPKAGNEGTMTYFGKNTNLHGNLRAKSGSMEGVRCYAGVFSAYTGREVGFAVLANNYAINSVELRKRIEKWLLELYGKY
jgi:D-alanyl-D-alanine carboxypeptidase/D-alanyl-D-alanine-endopeptidase (penicillin-binding protein 4)